MLTKDDVHNCCLDAQNGQNGEKIDSHNYSLDDVLLGRRGKSQEKRSG